MAAWRIFPYVCASNHNVDKAIHCHIEPKAGVAVAADVYRPHEHVLDDEFSLCLKSNDRSLIRIGEHYFMSVARSNVGFYLFNLKAMERELVEILAKDNFSCSVKVLSEVQFLEVKQI